MINICIYGNCQVRVLGKILKLLQIDNNINITYLPANYKLINGSEKITQKEVQFIQEAHIFIAQHLEEKNIGYRINDLVEKYSDILEKKIILIPYVFFSGYWPDYKQVNKYRRTDNCALFDFPFGSLYIDEFVDSPFTGRQIYNEIERKFAVSEVIVENIIFSLKQLQHKEQSCDIIISDYIIENFRKKRLFYAACHPTLDVYLKIVERIILNTDIFNEEYKISLIDELYKSTSIKKIYDYNNHQLPVYPFVSDFLNLEFPVDMKYLWFGKSFSIYQYIEEYIKFAKGEIRLNKIDIKHKHIINLGMARSGTTALHAYFKSHPNVGVPKGTKGIKYFLQKDGDNLSYSDYIKKFDDNYSILFESSPPYMHSGIETFNSVIDNVNVILKNDICFVINVRTLVARAFSHYWHDISKHYSVFGKPWSVRSYDSLERFKTLYNESFEISIKKNHKKFMPNLAEMVEFLIKQYGKENIFIFNMKYFNEHLKELSSFLQIEYLEHYIKRVKSIRAPIYLKSGKYEFNIDEENKNIKVDTGELMRVGYDGIEILKEENGYNIEEIYQASLNWTKKLDVDEIPEIFQEYVKTQEKQIKIICEKYNLDFGRFDSVFDYSSQSIKQQELN